MIPQVREFAPSTGCPDGILPTPEEDRHLGDVEESCAVLEHLWNTNVVDRWGPLVIPRLFWC